MRSNRIIFFGFIFCSLFQIGTPLFMISQREKVLAEGKDWKFRTQPLDPYDPYMGRYISLRFSESQVTVDSNLQLHWNQRIYLELAQDDSGFAKVIRVSLKRPEDETNYVAARVGYYWSNKLNIEFPFSTFYMEESKALPAEELYMEKMLDSSQVAYALVSILEGKSVLKNVFINDKPIGELVSEQRGNE